MLNENFSLNLKEQTVRKMLEKKKDMGFGEKSWEEWFEALFNKSLKENTSDIIERVFQEKTFEKWFDVWANNFALNLENIWNGKSSKEFFLERETSSNSAIVIGRGPTIKLHNHLERLAESKFQGTIVCCDGALKAALNAGVTPERFKDFFVVSVDAQDSIKDFYDDKIVLQFGSKIKGIFSTTISPLTVKMAMSADIEVFWFHPLVDYNKGKTSFNHITGTMTKSRNHKNGLPGIQTGGNVGTASWIISWSILKCSPIALLGIDHGYSADTSWEEIGSYHQLPDNFNEDSDEFKKAYPKIYNPDFKCYCIQDPVFQYYSNALKGFIAKAPKWVKTINATQGGAIFGERVFSMSFLQFLEEYSK